MLRLLIFLGFGYALFVNFLGVCTTDATAFGCVSSNETLLAVFVVYLIVGMLFFAKRWFFLLGHRARYRVKRAKFGVKAGMFLMVGATIIGLYGMQQVFENSITETFVSGWNSALEDTSFMGILSEQWEQLKLYR